MPVVEMVEWAEATPATEPALRGVSLRREPSLRALLDRLENKGMLTAVDRLDGASIATTSFVGSLNLGDITLRIRPKLDNGPLSALFGYALGLRKSSIELLPDHEATLSVPAFQDLLIHRLCVEASLLIRRGLHRKYSARQGTLSSPRGRILFSALAREQDQTDVGLPCRYFERDDNTIENRVLLGGLRTGASLALNGDIRLRAARLAGEMALTVSPIPLSVSTFRLLERSASRLTSAYAPAFRLIRLIEAGHGITTTQSEQELQLPGFMFDMNQLFQDLVERFLRDWLWTGTVQSQFPLKDIFRYEQSFNPWNRRPPTPRPDLVVMRQSTVVAILDAKYRDLWSRSLPREMLYQLTIYALSQATCSVATILYPVTVAGTRESRVSVKDPVSGQPRAEVRIRPVDLNKLADLVTAPRTFLNDRAREEFAEFLVTGVEASANRTQSGVA
ncbi:MAG: hypothetical protein EXR78_10255 [Deltaproteobacteria bacterium]|nr:hypothetical protein [Deltaproteobacteria bacterium]